MMAALELAQAHTEGRVIWGPVLAFAHGQGDKVCEEPYKFPCAKDGSFGTYVYYMHAERLYDNVHDVLPPFNVLYQRPPESKCLHNKWDYYPNIVLEQFP